MVLLRIEKRLDTVRTVSRGDPHGGKGTRMFGCHGILVAR